MMLQTTLLSLVILSFLTTLCLCQEGLEVINTGRFGTDENTIELECRSNITGSALARARFWLNDVARSNELQALEIDITERQNNRIIFQITQELEGIYFCGRNLENFGPEGLPLIGECHVYLSIMYKVFLSVKLRGVCMHDL